MSEPIKGIQYKCTLFPRGVPRSIARRYGQSRIYAASAVPVTVTGRRFG